MPITKIGTIVGFHGSWGSGLGTLVFEDDSVFCENAQTVRELDRCFGNVIGDAHDVKQEGIQGKRIVYTVDDMGILLAFTPEEDWNGPEIPPEGLEEDG